MKKTLLSLAVGAAALIGLAPEADAGPRYSSGFGYNTGQYRGSNYHSGSRNSIHSYVGNSFRGNQHCTTPRKVSTSEICRRRICKTAYNSCGQRYTYHVTVVTYRDFYSNGTSRTYTRTYS